MPVEGESRAARAGESGLERLGLLARKARDVVYAVAARRGEHAFECAPLLFADRDNEFAAAAIGDAMGIAIGVERACGRRRTDALSTSLSDSRCRHG